MKILHKKNRIISFLILISIFFIKSAYADFEIVIKKELASAQPIAIVPFKGLNVVSDIISNDLRYTGKFNPMFSNNMPQKPSNADLMKKIDIRIKNEIILFFLCKIFIILPSY